MTASLADHLIEVASIEQDATATPGQRLARRVEAAIAREPDAARMADRLRDALAEATA